MSQQGNEKTYTPVRITTIKANREVNFPVFIHFKNVYLEYLKSGSQIESDKYKKLRKQKITKFYIQSSDEKTYQSFLDSFLEETLNSKEVSVEEKSELVTAQTETAIDRMKDDPGSEESYDMTRKAAKNLQRLIFENPESLNNVFGAEGDSDAIVQHSINVAALSIKFAKTQKVEEEDIDFLSTASLMHDVGVLKMEENHQELFNKPRNELTIEDKKVYYDHCKGVVKHLTDKPYINDKVIELIECHEETLQGSGPLQKMKLTKPQEILALVNCYDKKIITNKISPIDALKEMMIDELCNYNLDLLKDFKVFLKKEGVV